MENKNVALIGYGNIGQEIANRLSVFGVNILAVNTQKKDKDNSDITYYSIEDLDVVLKQSDIVVVLLPYKENTHHLFNYKTFNEMKTDSVFINVSRGKVVNENELIDILNSNLEMYACLDVFEKEPLPLESPLWEHPRIKITPHNSFVSELNQEKLHKVITENISVLKING